jgi:hypothetical protein
LGTIGPAAAAASSSPKAAASIAGETLGYFDQRVLEVHEAQTPVLAMGDFNDEPFDTSLVLHALSTRQRAKVISARQEPLLWNLSGRSPARPMASRRGSSSNPAISPTVAQCDLDWCVVITGVGSA